MRYRSFMQKQISIASNGVKLFGRDGEPRGGIYEDGKENDIYIRLTSTKAKGTYRPFNWGLLLDAFESMLDGIQPYSTGETVPLLGLRVYDVFIREGIYILAAEGILGKTQSILGTRPIVVGQL